MLGGTLRRPSWCNGPEVPAQPGLREAPYDGRDGPRGARALRLHVRAVLGCLGGYMSACLRVFYPGFAAAGPGSRISAILRARVRAPRAATHLAVVAPPREDSAPSPPRAHVPGSISAGGTLEERAGRSVRYVSERTPNTQTKTHSGRPCDARLPNTQKPPHGRPVGR